MADRKRSIPDMFDDHALDPVETATGRTSESKGHSPGRKRVPAAGHRSSPIKKKAGFYLAEDLLDRFNRKFYELKLAGVNIDNKSALLELALVFALEDLEKGKTSRLLRKLQ